jgi:hypothetical protein
MEPLAQNELVRSPALQTLAPRDLLAGEAGVKCPNSRRPDPPTRAYAQKTRCSARYAIYALRLSFVCLRLNLSHLWGTMPGL